VRRVAAVTLSRQGVEVARRIKAGMRRVHLYAHASVEGAGRGIRRFERVVELTGRIFDSYDGLVFIAPCGVVVRAVCGRLRGKLEDPAVVVVDVGARYAVSLVGGHEAGANALALEVGNLTGAEPVISTTTEAVKDVIVGVGCRRGAASRRIVEAVRAALAEAGVRIESVRLIASADVKARERGLIAAAAALGVPFRVVSSASIRTFAGAFEGSAFVMEKVNVPAVAEPAALLAGRRTSLLLSKRKYDGVTVALAREGFLS
jgi:cobalt-precorrin 5A hydrolase